MQIKEWTPYLCFFVDDAGKSVYSPQHDNKTPFHGTLVEQWSATPLDRTIWRANHAAVFATGETTEPFPWTVHYAAGDERRYLVCLSLWKDIGAAMVRLYRTEGNHGLTAQETRVVRMICNDKSDKEISKILECSTATVRSHVAKIKTKLRVNGRCRMAIEAYRLGIVRLRSRKEHIR